MWFTHLDISTCKVNRESNDLMWISRKRSESSIAKSLFHVYHCDSGFDGVESSEYTTEWYFLHVYQ